MREKRDHFVKFMEECNLSTKATYSEFSSKYGKDERFKGVEKSRDRESLFNEHLIELRRREKEERQAKRDQIKRDFIDLLKDSSDFVDRHSSWSDVKKKLETDPRFKAVESSREREDYFLDYMHDLKEEHRKEKEKKKRRSRSRSRSKGRSSRRSRSRSRSRSRKSRSKSREKDKKKKSKKRSRSRDESVDKKKRRKDEPEREEGEMSEEEEDFER